MKELPKMYHNNIDKNINNNKKIFSTMYNSDTEVKSTNNFTQLYTLLYQRLYIMNGWTL